jgi:hypothetical protein
VRLADEPVFRDKASRWVCRVPQPGLAEHAQTASSSSSCTYDMSSARRIGLEPRGVRVVKGEVARLLIEANRLTAVELAEDGRSPKQRC